MTVTEVNPDIPLIRLAKVREWTEPLSEDGLTIARLIRETAHITLTEVARSVGVRLQTVKSWERGRYRPTGEQAMRYLAVLEDLARHDSLNRNDPATLEYRQNQVKYFGQTDAPEGDVTA